MDDVLDYLIGLPVTSRVVSILEGRHCAPDDALGRPHHPLERPVVAGGVVAVPGDDTALQEALNCASVKACRGQAEFLEPPKDTKAFHLLHCFSKLFTFSRVLTS